MRVVVVDDRQMWRDVLRSTVEGRGHEVVGEAANGEEGLELATRHEPDAVVMDWSMPVMDGLEATRKIRHSLPRVQVIAFTSATDPRIHDAFLEAGAFEHIEKWGLHHLLDALERCA